jgi:recombination protein RecR
MYSAAVQDLIDELGRLPGIGPKSAQRIAFYLLKLAPEDALRLSRAINVVKDRVSWCRRCFNIAEMAPEQSVVPSAAYPDDAGAASAIPDGDRALAAGRSGPTSGDPGPECQICLDPRRDASILCVVEEPRDVVAMEKTREYRGRYHVLQGAISPIDGIGPDKLRIRELLVRLEPEGINEIILCTNPNTEGEATALYLASLLKDLPVKVTKMASGLPAGGDLEYADEITLVRALEGRRELVN